MTCLVDMDFLQILEYRIYMSGVKGDLFTAFYMAGIDHISRCITIGLGGVPLMQKIQYPFALGLFMPGR